jgi:bile acid-coenzyme A ligase
MSGQTPLGVVLGRLAQAAPDRPAVTCGASTLTRVQLEGRTNRLARAYRARGVTPDSFVTIGLPNGIELYESVVAVWKLGATPQPISSRLPAVERRAIIDLAEPSLVVGVDPAEASGRPTVPAGFEPDTSLSAEPLPPAVAASFKAPTSGGSTGRPKLIVATQPAVWEAVEGFAAVLRIPADGVHLVTGPLYHNGPFTTSLLALLRGNHLVVMPRFDAAGALGLVERYGVDWMYAVPTMMHRIWRLPEDERRRHDVSSLRVVFHMAAPCPPWLKEAWIDWLGGERVLELYGEMVVLDDSGRELPAGEVGEIWMRRGAEAPPPYRYVGATPKARPGSWESLGDMGWKDQEGYIYLSDRESDMILVGGANVYPAEVEAALDEHPDVASSCVIGLPDEEYGNAVHAIVQAAAPLAAAQLDEFLATRLAKYKRPRTYEFAAAPLRGDDGKVRRSALRAARVTRAGAGGTGSTRT